MPRSWNDDEATAAGNAPPLGAARVACAVANSGRVQNALSDRPFRACLLAPGPTARKVHVVLVNRAFGKPGTVCLLDQLGQSQFSKTTSFVRCD